MTGPTPQSLTALRPKLTLPLEYPDVRGMKIAYCVDQGWAEVAATGMGPEDALEAANTQEALNIKVQEAVFTQGSSALTGPTMNTSALPADYDPTQDSLEINGKTVDPHAGAFQTPLWNLLNWYPALNVPMGLTSYNMPAGMQIVANTFEDAVCMQVGLAREQVSPALFRDGRVPSLS